MFQSTHPRRVRLGYCMDFLSVLQFQSTHPRRVRQVVRLHLCPFRCFNPRTHAGCDMALKKTMADLTSFNPRTHAGCDSREQLLRNYWRVSIHAPTQGATLTDALAGYATTVSIHAPTQGATNYPMAHLRFRLSFNPRTHAGCDLVYGDDIVTFFVSIHAPTQGAT